MRIKRNESGQATIEFALTLILLLVFVFFYVQLGFVMAVANYVQYATFMSARALESSAPTDLEQSEAAGRVLGRMVKKGANDTGSDRWPTIARGVEGDLITGATIGNGSFFAPKNRDQSWQEGVRYTFRSKLFLLPFGDTPGAITLSSEAWLGREPTKSQCETFMSGVRGLIDNGC